MRALAVVAVVLALSSPGLAGAADAPKTCHNANGKTIACAKPRKKPAPVDNGTSSFLRCRDIHTHLFTKCGGANAEPVPAN